MTLVPIACGGFLLAVLWFDLMFDVQVSRHRTGDLPEPVLASIAGYYRRVTTDAQPMTWAVAVVMLIGVAAVVRQCFVTSVPAWASFGSLLLGAVASGLALARVVPNAMRLGSRSDSIAEQSALARRIYRDHLLCLAAIAGFLALQLAGVSA
jgi:hypothetical protein